MPIGQPPSKVEDSADATAGIKKDPAKVLAASPELLTFYYMADRESNEEQWREEAKEEFENEDDESIDEQIQWWFQEGNWDHDEYLEELKQLPPDKRRAKRLEHFQDQYVKSREENEDSSLVYFEEPKVLGKTTLYRFTPANPEEVLRKGFSGKAPERLGLTHHEHAAMGDLAFAFEKKDLKSKKDIRSMMLKYGSNVFQFTVPYAVKAYHNTDWEDQVVFDVTTVQNLKLLWTDSEDVKLASWLEAAVSATDLKTDARRHLDRFYAEYKLPDPEFRIVDQASDNWLGRTHFAPQKPETCLIEIQKRVMGDEETLDRVLVHELIHHADFLINYKGVDNPFTKRLLKRDAHGKFFRDESHRINVALGPDYVTEKSDKDFVIEDKKAQAGGWYSFDSEDPYKDVGPQQFEQDIPFGLELGQPLGMPQPKRSLGAANQITLRKFLEAVEAVADEQGFAFPEKAYFQCSDFSYAVALLAKELGLPVKLFSARVKGLVDHPEIKKGEMFSHTLLQAGGRFYDFTARQVDPECEFPYVFTKDTSYQSLHEIPGPGGLDDGSEFYHKKLAAKLGLISDEVVSSGKRDRPAKTVATATESFLPEDLVMVDCEMTGVMPDRDKLLQIAMTKLRLQGNQYAEQGEPLVLYMAHDGQPQNDFHRQYLTHIFKKCNESKLQAPEAKQKIHEWLGPLKGKVTPVGDCVPTDIDFLRHAGCIDSGDIGDDGPIPGTFHYEYADMNLVKALARAKMGKKEDKKELAGFDGEGIHDALVDCRNQTHELNHFIKVLVPVPVSEAEQIEALTKQEIKEQYAGKTSFLYYPVHIDGETDEHHITVKFFDKVPVTPQQIEQVTKGIQKTPPAIPGWKPVVLNGKKGPVKVLELEGLPAHVADLHNALEQIRPDDYPDYRPHVTVSDELWEKIKAEKLQPGDLGVQAGPLTFEAYGKIEKVFAGFRATAKFETAFDAGNKKSGDEYVEVFRNPSAKELRQAEAGNGDVRAFLDGNDLLVWDAMGAIHAQAAKHVKLGPDPIPLVIYLGSDGISVQVTDYSQRTKWNHNPEVAQAIDNHPWIKRFSQGQQVEIGYYDEAIVGPWCELEPERVEAAVQVAFLKQPKLWDGKQQVESMIKLKDKIYVVDQDPVQWVVDHLDIPEGNLFYMFYDKGENEGDEPTVKATLPTELPPLFFENYNQAILYFNNEFRTFEKTDALQNFILTYLNSRRAKIPSFHVRVQRPALNKLIATQAFLKNGLRALSVIDWRLQTQQGEGDFPYYGKAPQEDPLYRMTDADDSMPYLFGDNAIVNSPIVNAELEKSITSAAETIQAWRWVNDILPSQATPYWHGSGMLGEGTYLRPEQEAPVKGYLKRSTSWRQQMIKQYGAEEHMGDYPQAWEIFTEYEIAFKDLARLNDENTAGLSVEDFSGIKDNPLKKGKFDAYSVAALAKKKGFDGVMVTGKDVEGGDQVFIPSGKRPKATPLRHHMKFHDPVQAKAVAQALKTLPQKMAGGLVVSFDHSKAGVVEKVLKAT